MKVIWEKEDIIVGRKFMLKGASEVWIIGYIPALSCESKYVNVSLSDGMVTTPVHIELMAEVLTAGNYLPIELLEGV